MEFPPEREQYVTSSLSFPTSHCQRLAITSNGNSSAVKPIQTNQTAMVEHLNTVQTSCIVCQMKDCLPRSSWYSTARKASLRKLNHSLTQWNIHLQYQIHIARHAHLTTHPLLYFNSCKASNNKVFTV